MAIAVIGLYLIGVHVILLVLCRHLVRRHHFAFFREYRMARGKPASYGHFLLLYMSWLDPATMTAAIGRPGYRTEQIKCGMVYGAGLVVAVLLGLMVLATLA